jgi:cation transport regulator
MPYASVHELPLTVREALPEHGQNIFLSAFNSAFKEYDGDEARVNAVAWSAVKNDYEQNEKGEWVRKAQTNNLSSFDNLAEFTGQYDITLQTLETRHPHPEHPDGLFYSADNFTGTEPAWDSRDLVVFVPPGKKVEHLDHTAFTNDPQSEVKRLGYRIAGRLNNTQTVTGQGLPRVITQVMLDDAEARKFADERKLGLSDAFDAVISPDGKLSGKVVPNHVLLFLKCAGKTDGFCGTPNDKGAQFNNLSENTGQELKDMDEQEKGMLAKMHDILNGSAKTEIEGLKSQIANLEVQNVDKQGTIDKMKADIEGMKKMLAEKETALAEMNNIAVEQAQKKKDERWQAVKNLYKPGMFHKPEEEKTLRESHEEDPVGFQLANVGNLQTVTVKKAEGVTAVGNLDDPDKPVDVVSIRGEYDPVNHVFKGA